MKAIRLILAMPFFLVGVISLVICVIIARGMDDVGNFLYGFFNPGYPGGGICKKS
jgi:hypothetical protein